MASLGQHKARLAALNPELGGELPGVSITLVATFSQCSPGNRTARSGLLAVRNSILERDWALAGTRP